ncbi:hypothetical protein C8R42DRAFT_725495 [Lentinula raphanica]|nr:hypothetical protein C8R42DRAFT_725495 [Lentinula raphanica]
MVSRASKRPAPSTSSSSASKTVDPAISAYTREITRKRKALARLPNYDTGDKEVADDEVREDEAYAMDVLKGQVLKAAKAAHWKPSDGRWAAISQILRLSCTQGHNFHWIAPQKQTEAAAPFDLDIWSEEVSDLLRRRWRPRAGPAYEKELLRRAQKEWIPTEAYPTRETAVVKQILEKKEWTADILKIVRSWFTTSTQDGSTEIRDILAKQKLVDSLPPFLETLIPSDASDASLVKDDQKEQWVIQVTHFIQHNGEPSPLVRNFSSSMSLIPTEDKDLALRERVANWQQTLMDHHLLPSDAPPTSGLVQSKSKSKDKETTTARKTAHPITAQTALAFGVSKPSANKLVGTAKPKPSTSRNPPPPPDDDMANGDSHDNIPIGFPSQPLSFHSSQIKHSTPKESAFATVEETVPSSSLSAPPLPTSPSRPPPITSVFGDVTAEPAFKRPTSPSTSTINTRPTKKPRTNEAIHDAGSGSPMIVDNAKKLPSRSSTNSRIPSQPPPPPPPSSSPLSAPPPTPEDTKKQGTTKKNRLPTLTELLSARKNATPTKKKNTLAVVSTPRPARKEPHSTVDGPSAPAPVANPVSRTSGLPATTATAAALSRHVSVSSQKSGRAVDHAKDRASSLHDTKSSRSKDENGTDTGSVRTQTAMVNAMHETQTSTSTYTVQHQPEFTASGYAIDLPLSVIDGFVGREGGGGGSSVDDDYRDPKGKGKEVEGGKPRKQEKKEKKKRGYFGMDDIDLTSPTRLKPGVVRPFADSSSEDGEEGERGDDARVGTGGAVALDKYSTPKNRLSAFDESLLPDFTNDLDAFDPPQASTQPRRSNSGNGDGNKPKRHTKKLFGAAPWADGMSDDDEEEEEEVPMDEDEQEELGYAAPQTIFTKDGAINVRSLDDDPTVHGQAFFSMPQLDSPVKKRKLRKGVGESRSGGGGDGNAQGDQDAFVFGYSSQKDVEGDVEMVSRFIDRDVDLMDADVDMRVGNGDEEEEDEGGQHAGDLDAGNKHKAVGGSYVKRDRSRIMWGGWS